MPPTRSLASKRKAKETLPTPSKRNKSDENENSDSSTDVKDDRPICKYGEKCYQKNSLHLTRFRHPHRENESGKKKETNANLISSNVSCSASETYEQGDVQTNLEAAVPSKEETESLPPSPVDVKLNIQQKYLVEMPDDFYSFWEFQESLSKDESLDSLGIKLVGPFELLEGKRQEIRNLSSYLVHWRFYFDPPEFQTVLVLDMETGHHLGYFRDSPKETPVFVGSNVESAGCVIHPYGDNLFSAVRFWIAEKLKKANPFLKTKLNKLKSKIEAWTSENDISLENHHINRRKKSIVAKTFYQSGIVVPVNKKTDVGYRPITKSNSELKKLFKAIIESEDESEKNKYLDELQTLVTYVQYANDEMDYGMGLELGLDLLAFGGEIFHSTIGHLLSVAYELLERQEFAVILKAHLKNRRRLSKNI